jgi:hypothetical protein
MMNIKETRAERINKIPHEIMKLKKQKQYAVKQNWHTAAAMIGKKIDELEKEFKELCNSYGGET